jgi:hypothetical protein
MSAQTLESTDQVNQLIHSCDETGNDGEQGDTQSEHHKLN